MILRVGRIDSDEEEIFEFGSDDAAFVIVCLNFEAKLNREWGGLTDDRSAGVTFFLSAIPVGMWIADKCKAIDKILGNLGFL